MTTTPVFLVDPELLAAVAAGDAVTVHGDEAHHARTVRRLAVGAAVELVDGAGRRARGLVAAGADRALTVTVSAVVVDPEPTPRITVVQAIAKGDRSEQAVEMLTEVGVDAIVPWAAERSIAVWRGDKRVRGVRRWESVARAAAKQSRRSRVPHIAEPADTAAVAELLATARRGLVLHEAATEPLATIAVLDSGDLILVVGPEGGISPVELARFESVGARAVRLGDSVLRTSTAGVVAAAVVLARCGRWSGVV
ncbi:MAG: 16S rRNA (uracil(1498)-N(3))-methyltransferase [Candidatus Nanopelagicales bacterium]